jgi:rubrerythrin
MVKDGEATRFIIERAIASEIASRRFYEALAAEMHGNDLRERVLELSREEASHEAMLIKAFPGMVDQERVHAFPASPQAPCGEILGMTLASILTLAMSRERDSEESYKAMAEEARDHGVYVLLLRLSEYERQHKVRLQRELEVLDPARGDVGQYGRFL